MILYLKGLGNLSLLEIALIFTILGAFLVFLGLYIMLQRHKASSRKRRFVKKQLTMEQALNDRLKQRRYERNIGKAEDKWKAIVLNEAYAEEVKNRQEEIGRDGIGKEGIRREELRREELRKEELRKEEIKKPQTERKSWEPSRRHKNAVKVEMFQENRKISHRREQLKRLEEGTALK